MVQGKSVLNSDQVAFFAEQGYLLLENALTDAQLVALRAGFQEWVNESRQFSQSYGQTLDGRARFDLEPGHTADRPALRRVSSPIEVSDVYLEVMRDSRALDAVTQLLGPNVKLNNTKVNSKLPGATTEVQYHQDFLFEPHSNYDLVAVLFFLDEVTERNGPLELVPASHLGPLYDHWHDGLFTGAIAGDIAASLCEHSIPCTGAAGSACLMHTRLVHGSRVNESMNSRTFYIVTYSAEDAYPLVKNHIPSRYEGEVVRGGATNRVRNVPFEMLIPEYPEEASFFSQQAKAALVD